MIPSALGQEMRKQLESDTEHEFFTNKDTSHGINDKKKKKCDDDNLTDTNVTSTHTIHTFTSLLLGKK